MKGIVIAIASVALFVGCATDRGGMGSDVYEETGYSGSDRYPADSPGMPNTWDRSLPGRQGPGGVGPGEPW